MIRIADGITIELRLFGLIGALKYDKYHFSGIVSALFLLLMGSVAVQQIITMVYLETIDQLTELLYIFGIFVVAFGKLYGIILNRNKIVNMLDGLNEKLIFPPKWIHLYHNEIVKSVRHVRISSRILTFSAYAAVLATFIATFWNHKPLFYCYFPFETRYEHSLQGYWVAYSYQAIYCIYLIQTNISMDILAMALLHCAAVKLKVMRYECENLCSHPNNCIENLNAIKTVVTFHIDTVKFIEDIERIFNFGLFVQCCVSGFSISIVMLKAILFDISTETEQLLQMIIILIAFANQLFFYCHYGNQIKHQSSKLFTSIYLCKWYKLNCNCLNVGKLNGKHAIAIKRSIFIMLERTKIPIIVTVGKLIEMTYESYIMICRIGYQSFAVLRDILK